MCSECSWLARHRLLRKTRQKHQSTQKYVKVGKYTPYASPHPYICISAYFYALLHASCILHLVTGLVCVRGLMRDEPLYCSSHVADPPDTIMHCLTNCKNACDSDLEPAQCEVSVLKSMLKQHDTFPGRMRDQCRGLCIYATSVFDE